MIRFTTTQKVICTMILMIVILGLIALDNMIKLEKADEKFLDLNNRLSLVEGHVPSLDLNDERFYEYAHKFNQNDQTLKERIEFIEAYIVGWSEYE